MTTNIDQAFDAANGMVNDCIQRISELEALKEVYQKLSKSEEYQGDPDLVSGELGNFIIGIQEGKFPLPIRGIFSLVNEYRTIKDINRVIKLYQETGNYWVKIRDQLGQE